MKKSWLVLVLLIGAKLSVADPAAYVLKWDLTVATPGQKGLVTLRPGALVTLARGQTNDVFELLGLPVSEFKMAHEALSLEFRFRFLRGTAEVGNVTIHADQHGDFIPAHHPTDPYDPFRPASQELFANEALTVPEGADSLQMVRTAIDTRGRKKVVSPPVVFALVGNDRAFIVNSGDSRGDDKAAPHPFLLGGPIAAGKPLTTVFDEYRAMNAWVRTAASKMYNDGIIATTSGADRRTMTCINKNTTLVYYSAWADLPLFEITTRVRFDQGAWQELPARRLFPAWGTGVMQDLFPFPFVTLPEISRAAGPYHPKLMATIFPRNTPVKWPPFPPPALQIQNITVPSDARILSVQTRIHAYLIAHYGKNFEGKPYVGDDCIKLYEDGQRVELEDLWDTPDFTPATAWTYGVN